MHVGISGITVIIIIPIIMMGIFNCDPWTMQVYLCCVINADACMDIHFLWKWSEQMLYYSIYSHNFNLHYLCFQSLLIVVSYTLRCPV